MAGYRLRWRPPGPVAARFVAHRPRPVPPDEAVTVGPLGTIGAILPIDILRGPIGGGKSVACAIRVFAHMMEQAPGPDGWRHTRWAVIRNTNPQLEMTTIKTWLEWFPEEHFGKFRWAKPFKHDFVFAPAKVKAEVWFVPLDDLAQVRNLLSLELTGAFVNECREIPREALIAIRSRCNRYPSRRDDGTGATWAGVICDTNSPDEDHYLAYWEGVSQPPEWMDELTKDLMRKPPGITIFRQPGGLLPLRRGRKLTGFRPNPEAENLRHLPPGYYESQIPGNTTRWLLTMCGNEYGPTEEVRVIYEDFDASRHVAEAAIAWEPEGGPLLLGADFARNPAVVVAQEAGGQLRILREFIGQNIDVAAFVRNEVVPSLKRLFPEARIRGWGDPAGNARTGGDDTTAFVHAREGGLPLMKGWTNDPDRRQRAVTRRLTTTVRGEPAILISPLCSTLIQGFKGGYRLVRVQAIGEARFKEEPEKNLYSHVHDALQYLVSNHDRVPGRPEEDDDRRRAAMAAAASGRPTTPNGRVRIDPLAIARASRRGVRR